ncbi:MAG: alpha/beta hydrolase, partial [Verrucomicrobia bacterium]
MTTRPQKRRLKSLIGLALLPVVCWGAFRWLETRLIYHPVRSDGAYPALSDGGWEKVTLRTPEGLALDARFHPPATPGQPVVLVCHGNAGHLGHRVELADTLLELGLGVLLFDYRGYGASEGRPSEDGLAIDAETAWQWLIDRGVAPTRILAMGVSLGGGVAVELATRRPLGGLILVSTFTSIPDVAADIHPWLPGKRLVRTRFDNRAKLPRLELPLLILHSRQD